MKRVSREGGRNQQQPLLLLLLLLFFWFSLVCLLAFLGWCAGDGEACQGAEDKVRGKRLKNIVDPPKCSTENTHTHAHTRAHTPFHVCSHGTVRPEHANDFHYANTCKSDPTI